MRKRLLRPRKAYRSPRSITIQKDTLPSFLEISYLSELRQKALNATYSPEEFQISLDRHLKHSDLLQKKIDEYQSEIEEFQEKPASESEILRMKKMLRDIEANIKYNEENQDFLNNIHASQKGRG